MRAASRETLTAVPARACLLYALLLGAATPVAVAQVGSDNPVLDSVRANLRKYEDPIVAIHDGYFSTLGCVEIRQPGGPGQVAYQPGGMGVHFLNPALLAPVPDPARPQALLYEPVGDSLRLVGAEWFIPLATGVRERPELFGQPFLGPMQGHHPLLPVELSHFDLHVWLFKPNPRGVFDATNPDVRCGHYSYTFVLEAPLLVPLPRP